MSTHNIYDVIIVGAGAAGLMAAAKASQNGKRVLIIEKNREVGKKLSITGGGRCNILNAEEDIHELLKQYKKSAQFLYSPFSEFGMADTREFFESHGLHIKVEDRKRAFPKSEKASDVVQLFSKLLHNKNVTLNRGEYVTSFSRDEHRIISVSTQKSTYTAHAFILATGGLSHPETGSTGDGFKFLKDLGHSVRQPTPTIVPLTVTDMWVKKCAGKTLENVKVTYQSGKKTVSKLGNILCTHTGLSGPLILNSSTEISEELYNGPTTIIIDLFPKTDIGSLNKQLATLFEGNKNKSLKNCLKMLITSGVAEQLLLTIKDIDPEKKVHSVTREERTRIATTFKKNSCTVNGLLGFDKAVVADGGVPLTEIDTKTFRSRKIENLYIIGDLLDIQRPSGGFSLQLCWTSGYVAANSL